ncbi:aldehyde dehydrogenase [Chitinophaga sp. CF118]|uniref:aldehyde dehydrogenase n=1 Tax=Chitinophaga sp. CF118 TaxID=1884367 RepID=UPI000B7CAB98|nr:aldehyde dehydrogenase [Chitinophaga sp. CF118]
MSIEKIYKTQQDFFASGATLSYDFRKEQLQLLKKAVKKYEQRILSALYADLHKPPVEAFAGEIGLIYTEITDILSGLKHWMRAESVSSPLAQYPSQSKIYRVPLGLTLIIAPWNYPFQLLMAPLAGAIAGGNCAVLKPSELAPHTAVVIETLIRETFDPAYIAVLQGEGSVVIPEAMQYRFDHVFFTGSTAVGKKILEMAAPHLTPVTLELGGKSPCIVDDKVNISVAAKRIIWGKYWNAGQTCIAPDYVLAHEQVKDKLVAAMKKAIIRFWGEDTAQSPDYGRIINTKRFNVLKSYLEQGRLLHGGVTDEKDLFIAPALLDDVDWNSPVMQEEIFGPILPIITFNKLEEAVRLIRQQPYPLSLYLFTKRTKTEKILLEQLHFGGGCINNTLIHFTNPELPFGGVGNSGMGRYHGKYSFETFTHAKSIIKTGTWLDVPAKYPPYKNKLAIMKIMMK